MVPEPPEPEPAPTPARTPVEHVAVDPDTAAEPPPPPVVDEAGDAVQQLRVGVRQAMTWIGLTSMP